MGTMMSAQDTAAAPTETTSEAHLKGFVRACAVLTGFEPIKLHGISLVQHHLDFVCLITGTAAVDELIRRITRFPNEGPHQGRTTARSGVRSTPILRR